MTTDPIADLLTRIKNASRAKHQELVVSYSRLKEAIVKILIKAGYLKDYKVESKKPQLKLKLSLKYSQRQPALTNLERISKPGVRHYVTKTGLYQLIKGRGITILSTSKGLMTAREAKKLGIGGEIICKIS